MGDHFALILKEHFDIHNPVLGESLQLTPSQINNLSNRLFTGALERFLGEHDEAKTKASIVGLAAVHLFHIASSDSLPILLSRLVESAVAIG